MVSIYGTAGDRIRRLVLILVVCVLAGLPPATAKADRDAEASETAIIAAIPRNFPPHYVVDKHGQVTGFAVDVFNEVVRRAGLTVTYDVHETWKGVNDALKSGKADVIPNMGITNERAKFALFTVPYETFHISLFVRSDGPNIDTLDDLKGMTVGTVTTNVASRILRERDDVTLLEHRDLADILVALLAGQVDALAYPEVVVRHHARNAGLADRIRVTGPPLVTIQRGIAVDKRNRELRDRLDRALMGFVKTSQFNAIYRSWLGPADPLHEIPWSVLFGIPSGILVLVGMFLLGRMGKPLWALREGTRDNRGVSRALGIRVAALGAVLATVSLSIAGGTLAYLYDISFREQEKNLSEFAKNYAHLVERIARFDRIYSTFPEGGEAGTLRQITEGLLTFGGTIEFTIARKQGEEIIFLFRQRSAQRFAPAPIHFASPLAEAMRRALLGQSGTVIGADYRDVTVLAAHEPIRFLDLGVVVKMDLAEIRAPFVRAGWFVAAITVLVVLVGVLAFLGLSGPIVANILDRERRFRSLFQNMGNAVAVYEAVDGGRDFVFKDFNHAGERIEGIGREDLVGRRLTDVFPGVEEFGFLTVLRRVWESGEPAHHPPTLYQDERISAWRENWVYRLPSGEVVAVYDDVTPKVVAEAALKESEARFRRVVENMPVMVDAFDQKGVPVFWNKECERVTGYDASHVLGNPSILKDFYPDPEYRAWVISTIEKKQGDFRHLDFDITCRDGSVRTISWSNISDQIPIPGWTTWAIGIDVTDRARAERTLAEHRNLLRGTLDGVEDTIILLDRKFTCLAINESGARRLRTAPEKITGRYFFDFLPEDIARKQMELGLRVFETGDPQHLLDEQDGLYFDSNITPVVMEDGTIDSIVISARDYTDLKLAQDALRESDRRLTTLIANLPGVVYRCQNDPDYTMEFVSDGIEALTGVLPDKLMLAGGISFARDIIHPDDITRVRNEIQAAVDQDYSFDLQYRVRGTDGTLRWVSERGRAVEVPDDTPAVLEGVMVDVTARVEAEVELIANRNTLRGTLDAVDDTIILLDRDFTCLAVNSAGARRLNSTPEEMTGRPITDFVPQRLAEARMEYTRQVFETGEPRQFQDERDGIYFESRLTPIFADDGTVWGVVVSARDYTALKQAQDEIAELNRDLEERVALRTAELESANQELEAFTYSVSHDLRGPLRGIDGFSQALLEDYPDKIDETGQGYLQFLRESAQEMGTLVDALLLLSRSSRVTFERSPIDLSALAEEVVADLRAAAPDRDVEVIIEPDLTAEGDRTYLAIALRNLIGNAWKFTGGTDGARIEISAEERDEGHVYVVRDNGAGFDMAYANKLFQPFQRLHAASEFSGTGIGLSTVQRIIRRHGGNVWGEGEVGKGAAFRFTLWEDRDRENGQ